MSPTPVLFVSHGSPMFALEPGLLGPNLEALGRELDAARAIVVVSPHWQTRGVRDPEYAQAFAEWVADAVARRDVQALVDYRARAPHAERAHPTEEHFLPLLVALGASGDAEPGTLVRGGMTYNVLSMDSFAFGRQAA